MLIKVFVYQQLLHIQLWLQLNQMTEKHPKEMLADGASLHQTHHLPKVRFSKWSRLKNLKLAYRFIIWQNILQPNIEYFIIIFNENYIICYLILLKKPDFQKNGIQQMKNAHDNVKLKFKQISPTIQIVRLNTEL